MRLVAADRFEAYGPWHLTVLAIFAVGVVVVIAVGRRPSERVVRRGAAVALLAITIPLQILQLTPDDQDPPGQSPAVANPKMSAQMYRSGDANRTFAPTSWGWDTLVAVRLGAPRSTVP